MKRKKSGHLKQAHCRNIYEVNSDIMSHNLVFRLFQDLGNLELETECSGNNLSMCINSSTSHLTVYEI